MWYYPPHPTHKIKLLYLTELSSLVVSPLAVSSTETENENIRNDTFKNNLKCFSNRYCDQLENFHFFGVKN